MKHVRFACPKIRTLKLSAPARWACPAVTTDTTTKVSADSVAVNAPASGVGGGGGRKLKAVWSPPTPAHRRRGHWLGTPPHRQCAPGEGLENRRQDRWRSATRPL
jgi:hypothetical protein